MVQREKVYGQIEMSSAFAAKLEMLQKAFREVGFNYNLTEVILKVVQTEFEVKGLTVGEGLNISNDDSNILCLSYDGEKQYFGLDLVLLYLANAGCKGRVRVVESGGALNCYTVKDGKASWKGFCFLNAEGMDVDDDSLAGFFKEAGGGAVSKKVIGYYLEDNKG